MHLCTIRETEIRVHPLAVVVLAGACVLGWLNGLLQALLALTLHEASHAIAAAAFGCRILSAEWMPFGAVLRLGDKSLSPHAEWCIAGAGPLTSFVIAGAASMVAYFFPFIGARIQDFLTFNLLLGVINLLPALPLDGGRIVKCALEKKLGTVKGVRLTAWTGVILGGMMLLMSVAAALLRIYNLTLPVMGVFLLLAAISELRMLPERKLTACLGKSAELYKTGLSVHEVAARESMTGMDALRLMRENRFNILRVVDERMHTVGELEEGKLMLGMARFGTRTSIGELLQFDRQGRL